MPRVRRRHPLAAIVLWLGVTVLVLLAALIIAVTERVALEARLDRVHLQGMAAGQALCINHVPERQRRPLLVQLQALDALEGLH